MSVRARSIKVRMAPSPTGYLHIGGVRTFLFNWLFARHHRGEFRLRIENTDTSREVAESVEQIQDSLRWLGIDWDGPVTFQLDRIDEVRAYADRIELRQDGRLVGEHARSFGRDQTVFDPWHYVPVLARKPGALRNGAPFKDWVLPAALERVRRKLAGSDDGDRQMVAILATVLTDGLPAVEAACAQAMSEGVHSSDVIINILARQRDPGPAATILTPDALRLRHAPVADCARYDQLRST